MNAGIKTKIICSLPIIFGIGITAGCSNPQELDSATARNGDGLTQTYSEFTGYKLINGQIITMDEAASVVSSLTIENDRIVSVDDTSTDVKGVSCNRFIDLKGKTVIPGLIDSHIHYVRAGSAPGHTLRSIETVFSITALLDLIQEQAKSSLDEEVISIIGGFFAATI